MKKSNYLFTPPQTHADWVVFLLYVMWFLNIHYLLAPLLHNSDLLSPLWPIFWLDTENQIFARPIIAGILLLSSLISLIGWKHRWVRGLVFVSSLCATAVLFSHGKVSHYYHGWVWALLALIFYPAEKNQCTKHQFLLGLQVHTLIPYFTAGVWKIYWLLHCWVNSSCQVNGDYFHSIFYATYYAREKLGELAPYFLEQPGLLNLIFCTVILLQLSAPLLAWKVRCSHLLLGLSFLAFHEFGRLLLNAPFYPQRLLILTLFIILPLTLSRKQIHE